MGDIFEIVEENIAIYNLKKIEKISLKIGEFTCVEDSALEFAFEAFSKDSIAEGAKLLIERVRASAECNNCGQVFNISFTNKICPSCSTFSTNIITGYELLLNEIEGE